MHFVNYGNSSIARPTSNIIIVFDSPSEFKIMTSLFVLLSVLSFLSTYFTEGSMIPRDKFPQIIAHRGASGYVPEHSLQAYQLAIDQGTDYIEPDLCLSKDGVFVALHDLTMDDVTNVASLPQYADRKTTKSVDGKNVTGYFVSDFLYSELQDIRLVQRLSERTTLYNNLLEIPTFTSIMSLAQTQYSKTGGHLVGIYPELKHPSFFHELGWAMEDMLLEALTAGGYEVYGSAVPNNLQQVVPVVVQCFDPESLVYLRNKTTLPLILLLEAVDPSFWNSDNLNQIASFADGIGPDKSYFATASYEDATQTVSAVRNANLRLHPYTFRADQDIGKVFNGDFATELMFYYCCLGMDALFSEFPDRSREALDFMGNYTTLVQSAGSSTAADCPIQCDAY